MSSLAPLLPAAVPSATLLSLLPFATGVLAVSAASLTAFGLRQRRYEGWRWWVAAMWLTTLGAAVAWLWPGAIGASLGGLLLMQWPVLTLVGLRRFHPRQAMPGSERQDWAVLAVATLACAVGPAADPALGSGLALAAAFAVHGYAASAIFLGPGGREFTPVQGLGGVMALAALAGLMGLPWLSPFTAAEPATAGALAGMTLSTRLLAELLPAQAAAAALGAVVMAFTALVLVCERTERQLRDSRRRLRTLANQDTLTQMPNRRHFLELADQALLQDEPGTAVLVTFDVDRFKQINDLFGHAAGDRALCLVGSAMLESLRAHDVPGRQGGDEFVLLLRRATPRDAIGVASRIVSKVQRRAPGQQLPTLSLSFGLVQVGFGEGIHAALRRADQAMYEAKRQGRSCAVAAAGNEEEPVFAESERLGLTAA